MYNLLRGINKGQKISDLVDCLTTRAISGNTVNVKISIICCYISCRFFEQALISFSNLITFIIEEDVNNV